MVMDREMLVADPWARVALTLAMSRPGGTPSSPSPVTSRTVMEPESPRCWRSAYRYRDSHGDPSRSTTSRKCTGPPSPVSMASRASDVSREYAVAVVGEEGVGKRRLVSQLLGSESDDILRYHRMSLGVVGCRVLFHIAHLDGLASSAFCRRDRADAVVFIYDPENTSTLGSLAIEAKGLRLGDYDMTKTVLVGRGEKARVFRKDNHLGHFVGPAELLDTLRTILSAGEGKTDIIRLGVEEEILEQKPRTGWC
jgi:hypothetical protein